MIWNDAIGSNAMPYPARITVLPPVPGLHVIPSLGAMAPILLRANQRFAGVKLTRLPSVKGPFGT